MCTSFHKKLSVPLLHTPEQNVIRNPVHNSQKGIGDSANVHQKKDAQAVLYSHTRILYVCSVKMKGFQLNTLT